MKRLFLILLTVCVLAAGGYVYGRHDGDLMAAWAAVRAELPVVGEGGGGSKPGASPPGRAGPNSRAGAAIPVVTNTAEASTVTVTRTGVGWVEPIATVTLRARIDGQVLEQRVRDGQMVKAGDVLFRLDDREIQAQIARDEANLTRAQATLAKAQSDLRRTQELLARNVASQASAEQLAAEVKVAAADVAAAEAALQADRIKLGYATVRAPIDGRVGVVRVNEGNIVRGSDSSGDGLVTITQMKPLRVSFALPERDLSLLREALAEGGGVVRLIAHPGEPPLAEGRLSFIDSSVDIATGTIQAKALVPNESGALWPGQYVQVEVDLGTRPGTVTVPLVAVQPGQEGSYVFVAKPDSTVEVRPVTVSETYGERAGIESGLKAGERVVIEGQLRLRNGSRISDRGNGTPPRTARAGEEARP